ncbi:MAG: hypothetical protein WC528_03140 [Patescibacteria group bacterium]
MENRQNLTKKSSPLLWLILAIIIIGLGIYGVYIYIGCNENTNQAANVNADSNKNLKFDSSIINVGEEKKQYKNNSLEFSVIMPSGWIIDELPYYFDSEISNPPIVILSSKEVGENENPIYYGALIQISIDDNKSASTFEDWVLQYSGAGKNYKQFSREEISISGYKAIAENIITGEFPTGLNQDLGTEWLDGYIYQLFVETPKGYFTIELMAENKFYDEFQQAKEVVDSFEIM